MVVLLTLSDSNPDGERRRHYDQYTKKSHKFDRHHALLH